MSMLSAQCDELRAMAESVGLAMPQAATLMMDAADTIWELRCRLVDAEDRVRKSGELCKLCEREAENAKLWELVRGLQYCAHEAYGMCARVPVGGERPFTCCPLYDFDAKEYQCEKLMLELGVVVTE